MACDSLRTVAPRRIPKGRRSTIMSQICFQRASDGQVASNAKADVRSRPPPLLSACIEKPTVRGNAIQKSDRNKTVTRTGHQNLRARFAHEREKKSVRFYCQGLSLFPGRDNKKVTFFCVGRLTAASTRYSRNAALALFSRLRALFSRLCKLQNNSYIQKKVRLGLRTPRSNAL